MDDETRKDIVPVVNSAVSAKTVLDIARQHGVVNDLGIYFGTYKVKDFAIGFSNLPGAKTRGSSKVLTEGDSKHEMADSGNKKRFGAAVEDAHEYIKELRSE